MRPAHSKSLLLLENGLLLGALYRLLRKRLQVSVFPLGAVRARHPEDLNSGMPPSYDGAHPSESRSYFEWWYFDARFTDGHTFAGGIMDPDAFGGKRSEAQVYLHVNTPDGDGHDVRSNHPRREFEASTERCDVRCAGSSIQGAYPVWNIDFEGEGLAAHLEFRSMLPGWARGNGEMVFGSNRFPAIFGWSVAQPRARVSGVISYAAGEFEVEGEGYHDHNWGDFNIPMRVSRWHWGRITTPEVTMVFADVATNRTCGRVHVPMLLLARGERLVLETYEMEWEYGDYALDSTGTQAYPRRVAFHFGEREISGRVEFRPREELEAHDLFEQMGVPVRARGPIGRYIAQPFYFRVLSDYEGEIDFGGEVVPISGETITEYMVFDRRRGSVPSEPGYANFLHP